MVDLEPLAEPDDIELVRDLLIQHAGYTGSTVAARLLKRLGIGRSRSSSRSCRSTIAACSTNSKRPRRPLASLAIASRQLEVSRG